MSDKFYRTLAKVICFLTWHRFTRIDWSVYYRGEIEYICEHCGATK